MVVAKDPKNDIAILKLEKSPPLSATPIKLGDSSQARTGEKIFTIGYPASKIMGESPITIQLRYLQTLTEVSAENSSTVVFPIPIEMLKAFQAISDKADSSS